MNNPEASNYTMINSENLHGTPSAITSASAPMVDPSTSSLSSSQLLSQAPSLISLTNSAMLDPKEEMELMDTDHIPTDDLPKPNLPLDDKISSFEHPVYAECPAFTIAWLLRILYYKYGDYEYITRKEINCCIHPGMRSPIMKSETKGKFGISWIWHCIWYMTADKDPLISWHWEDPEDNENRRLAEDLPLPESIQLTERGRAMAVKLGNSKKPLKPKAVERARARKVRRDDDEGSARDTNPVPILEQLHDFMNELVALRKENMLLKQQLLKYQHAANAHSGTELIDNDTVSSVLHSLANQTNNNNVVNMNVGGVNYVVSTTDDNVHQIHQQHKDVLIEQGKVLNASKDTDGEHSQ